jgi:uncharacterized protein HemY
VLVIIIGLVLLIVAAVFGLDLIWKNHYTIRSPASFGQTLGIHNAAEFFIIGAIAAAILLLGIAMMLAGLRRKGAEAKRHRAERKEARNAGRDRDKAQEETTNSAAGSTATPALVSPAPPPPPTRSHGTQVRTPS